jgi:outer membrane protein OmpA-like peptidoglycan-associated protein
VLFGAAGDPLTVRDEGGHIRGSIERSLGGEFELSVGIGWQVEVLGSMGGETFAREMDPGFTLPSGSGLEEARLGARYTPFEGLLAVSGTVGPNNGAADLIVEGRTKLGSRVAVSGMTGLRERKRKEIVDAVFDDSLAWGGAAQVSVWGGLWALAGLHGEKALRDGASPTEWMTGLRLDRGPFEFYVLGGTGVGSEVGTPAWRMSVAATYRPELPKPKPKLVVAAAPRRRWVPPDPPDETAPPQDPLMPTAPELDDDKVGIDIVDPETPNVVVVNSDIQLGKPVFFVQDRKRVRSAFHPILDELAVFLNKHREVERVRIEGHADGDGRSEWNEELSRLRAEAVVSYLVARGVDRKRLEPLGYGAGRPWAPNDSDEGRAQNRRVVFTVMGSSP